MMKNFLLLIFFCCHLSILFSNHAQAQVLDVSITHDSPDFSIKPRVFVLQDSIGNLRIQDIIQPQHQKEFRESTQKTLNFEFSEDWYWIKIDLQNQSTEVKWLLEIAEVKIEYADLYFQDSTGQWQVIHNGYSLPLKQKFHQHYFQIFPLSFYQKQATFYLHTKGNLSPIPLKIMTEQSFFNYNLQKNLVYGIYYGLLLFMAFNNLLLGLFTQNRAFILYVGVVICYTTGSALISGYIKWITEANILSLLGFTTFSLSAVSALYTKQFLNIKNQYWEGKLLNIEIGFMMLCFVLTFFAKPVQAMLSAQLIALLHLIIIIVIAVASIKREKQFAIYYLSGFILLTVFVSFEISYSNTGSPAYLYLTHVEWGYLSEVLILSFALNLRFFIERKQLYLAKELAQKEALDQAVANARLVSEQNQILEQKVESRTIALREANEELTTREKEVLSQNEELKTIQEELKQNMEEFRSLNEHLELIVDERTLELQNTVEELTQKNQDLEQFSYIVSHNMRAPVARILGLLSLYNREQWDHPFNQELLGYLDQTSHNLDSIIRDMTDIITTRNRLDKVRELIDLEKLSYQVLDTLRDEIDKSQAQIVFKFDSDLSQIDSVKGYLQSILYNLISNSIKYKSPDRLPVVTIGTQLVHPQWMIYVQDNGMGIDLSQTNAHKIFGLYQRLHNHIEGRGLGLYLVKAQVEALNGKIEVESTLDVGSTFKIYFPLTLEKNS